MITKLMAGGETLAAEGDTTNSNAAIRYTGFRLRLGRLAYIDCGPTRSYRGKRTSLWRQRTCPACQCCVSFRKADGTLSSATFLFCFFFASFKNFFIFSFFSFFFDLFDLFDEIRIPDQFVKYSSFKFERAD